MYAWELCVIDHGDFSFSYYLHLQQYSVGVEVGQSVGAGHQIGKIGNTGYSTEAHLHLEISNGFGNGDSIMILFEELAYPMEYHLQDYM